MPLPGREVGPVRICQARFVLSNAPDKEGSVHNLEETTYIALVGVMKQLGDIAEYADEIFGSVYDIARQTVQRTSNLSSRLTLVNEKLKKGHTGNSEVHARSPDPVREQALLNLHTRPPSIRDKYDEAAPAPPLSTFTGYNDEGRKAAMKWCFDVSCPDPTLRLVLQATIKKALLERDSYYSELLYSDPALFVNSWIKLMNKEAEELKKPRKRSFKKPKSHERIPNKMATLKKKVHDPKTKGGYKVVDVEPQYATLPLRDGPTRDSICTQVQHSKSLDRSASSGYTSPNSNKVEGRARVNRTRSTVCPSQIKLFRQSSFNNDLPTLSASPSPPKPMREYRPQSSLSSNGSVSGSISEYEESPAPSVSPDIQVRDVSPTSALSTLSRPTSLTPLEENEPLPSPEDLPPPPEDFILVSSVKLNPKSKDDYIYDELDPLEDLPPPPTPPPASPVPPSSPLPPRSTPPSSPVFASSPTVSVYEPPPFSPPPVPEDAIKAAPLTIAQRVLRTQSVPELDGRDTLLEAIRSASVSLKPKELRKMPIRKVEEPIYALTGGTDVASILQRRKFLMGTRNDSDGSSSDESGEESWD